MINFEIKNNESGRSMIEMLGVLAIIGVLSVGGIAGYSKAMTKYRINNTIEQITLIAGNIRSFFASQINYDGLSDATVIKKAKLVPDEMWDDSYGITEIINEFGYIVNLNIADKSTSGDNRAFHIDYSIGMHNEEVCIELLSQDWTTAGVKAIYLTDHDMVNFKLRTPVNIDKAVEKCSAAIAALKDVGITESNVPYLEFYFDIDLSGAAWKNNSWQN